MSKTIQTTPIQSNPVADLLARTDCSKSYKIRKLFHTHGFSKSHIALMLDIKYQHVRNVLLQVLKSNQS